jgi:tRNA A37 threonylcarbamoyladenosine synthetase subunit TsaC/SUA5/YrdC
MNIDERPEALTHSVELLASLHRDNEKRMERLDQHMENFAEEMKRLGKRNLRLESLVVDIAEGTARLLRAVETHEQRISDLEGKQTQ